MFDSLFPDAADSALTNKASRAPEPQSTPWFKGFWGAAGSAPLRAGAESARALTSLMTPEAAGAMDAPSMFGAPGSKAKPQLQDELRAQESAIKSAIKEMTPDANSTGVASMIVHDVGRFVSKAAGYGVLGGAPGAVIGMSLDEGYNEAARRMDEGVDAATAAKLGLTKGIASGIAVALPVAGKTLAGTMGLAAAGGPGSYVAEQATAREILRGADYTKEAAEIDPFDPLGLGVSFLGSMAFGGAALAARGMRGKGVEPGVEPPPSQQTQVAQAVERAYTPEQVDAAHVTVLQAQREGLALHAADDVAASAGHARALDTAAEQIAVGQRVSVADVAPVDGARMLEAVRPAAERLAAAMREVPLGVAREFAPVSALDEVTAAQTVEVLQRAGLGNLRMVESAADLPPAVRAKMEAEGNSARGAYDRESDTTYLVRSEIGSQDEAFQVALHESFHRGLRVAIGPEVEPVLNLIHDGNERVQVLTDRYMAERGLSDRVEAIEEVLADMAGQAEAGNLAGWDQLLEVIKGAITKIAAAAGIKVEVTDEMVTDLVAGIRRAGMRTPVREGGDAQVTAKTADAAALRAAAEQPGGKPAEPDADYIARQAEAVDPNMMVMLEGMDAPRPASEVMAEIMALAKQEADDAPLLQVAAECALRG